MNKAIYYIYLMLLLANSLQAQSILDTIFLPEVKLVESRLSTHNIATHINRIEPQSLSDGSSVDLADLISGSSSVYLKKYGALATPAFRGTLSSHTLVLWNGMPVNSITTGLSDFSSIYCQNFSDIIIFHGGDASVFGSGAIGGSIHLNTNIDTDEKNLFSFSLTRGSYGLESRSIAYTINNGKVHVQGSFLCLDHKNNFEYINTAQIGRPLSINDYGKIKSRSQNFDLIYKFNANTNYNFSLWNSSLDREVPQNMTISFSDAKQYDNSKRILLNLNHKLDDLTIILKQAYIQEDFRYTELLKKIDSKYLSQSYISDADIKFLLGRYLINFGAGFINNKIENSNYSNFNNQQKSTTIFSAFQYKNKKIALNTILRKEWNSTFKVPLVPTFAYEAKLFNSLKFRAKYNRGFRSPTFNDRFWIGPGSRGNPNLESEDAWNKEVGFDLTLKGIKFSVTAYNLHLSNMILWQQLESGDWMPDNISKVLSRGVELTAKLTFNRLNFIGNYTFTKSTNQFTTNPLDNTVGQQLRYVPEHKGNLNILIQQKNLQFSLINSYTGPVIATYAIPDNKMIDSFLLTDFSIKYISALFPVSIQGKVKNLLNKNYVTYQNYPNPGRELLLTLNYIIK